MHETSHKGERVNGEVQRALSSIISHEIKDPRISPMTSVTDVNVTPDLKYCKVFISVLGDEDAAADTLEGLNSGKGYIRRALAKEVNLRNTPELTFVMDNSISYGIEMSKRIDEVMKDAEQRTDQEN